MPFQHTPLCKQKIDKSGPSSAFGLGGAAAEYAGFWLPEMPERPAGSRPEPQPLRCLHPIRAVRSEPQNKENFTLRYLLGSFRNSFRSRRRSPAAPLMLS